MSAWKRHERIGDCELWLGDAREIIPLVNFDSIASDPPFGMSFQSNYRTVKHTRLAGDDDTELLVWACCIPVKHSRYIFCRWDNLPDIPKPKSLVTWVKNNWSMGDLNHEHGRQTEVCAFYPGPEHHFPKGRPADVIHCARSGNEHHGTEKPVPLMRAVVEWTDGVVADPFMGSGSTLVAAAKLGRRAVGIELDPKHFDTACRRVEDAYRQPDLFVEPPKPAVQESLL